MKDTKTKQPILNRVFRKRTIAIASFSLGILATIVFFSLNLATSSKSVIVKPQETTPYDIRTLKGYRNIQPVISVDPKEEAEKFMPLKAELNVMIDNMKREGKVKDVSIFLKQLNKGYWLSIGDDLRFHPASLMKVPLMLAVLKAAEADHSLLKKEIVYKKYPEKRIMPQHFTAPSIVEGKSYTIHDLLYYCIAYSDNHAAHALETNFDLSSMVKLFGDAGLPVPNLYDADYTMTVKEYSTFMAGIYRSAFLSPDFSEYAAEMMVNSSFDKGFAKGLPSGTKSWRKFGEWVRPNADVELHESGIYFLDGRPFLLTVMTRGSDLDVLSNVLEEISKLVGSRTGRVEFGTCAAKRAPFLGC